MLDSVSYALPAWDVVSKELVGRIDAFLKRSIRYAYRLGYMLYRVKLDDFI